MDRIKDGYIFARALRKVERENPDIPAKVARARILQEQNARNQPAAWENNSQSPEAKKRVDTQRAQQDTQMAKTELADKTVELQSAAKNLEKATIKSEEKKKRLEELKENSAVDTSKDILTKTDNQVAEVSAQVSDTSKSNQEVSKVLEEAQVAPSIQDKEIALKKAKTEIVLQSVKKSSPKEIETLVKEFIDEKKAILGNLILDTELAKKIDSWAATVEECLANQAFRDAFVSAKEAQIVPLLPEEVQKDYNAVKDLSENVAQTNRAVEWSNNQELQDALYDAEEAERERQRALEEYYRVAEEIKQKNQDSLNADARLEMVERGMSYEQALQQDYYSANSLDTMQALDVGGSVMLVEWTWSNVVTYQIERVGSDTYRLRFDNMDFTFRGSDWKKQAEYITSIRSTPILKSIFTTPEFFQKLNREYLNTNQGKWENNPDIFANFLFKKLLEKWQVENTFIEIDWLTSEQAGEKIRTVLTSSDSSRSNIILQELKRAGIVNQQWDIMPSRLGFV